MAVSGNHTRQRIRMNAMRETDSNGSGAMSSKAYFILRPSMLASASGWPS